MQYELSRVLDGQRWLVSRPHFAAMLRELLQPQPARVSAAAAALAAYEAAYGENRTPAPEIDGEVAIISMCGPITYKPSLFSMYFGGATVKVMRGQFRAALVDPGVKAIVFKCDTPGGEGAMIPEFADEIFAARKQKPILAYADLRVCSAGYWLASQAHRIFGTFSSRIGSIGVYAQHEDISGMLEQLGVKVTLIHYGSKKVEGNQFQALDEAARASIQADVDEFGRLFDAAVARGRGVTPKAVRDGFGQGDVFDGDTAVALGMADKTLTWDELLQRAPRMRVQASEISDVEPAAADLSSAVGISAPVVGAAGSSIAPGDDGACPEGYEKRNDGLCYPLEKDGDLEARTADLRHQHQHQRDHISVLS